MSRGTVLVVDDEFVVVENLRAELVSLGYEVVGLASSGKKAMDLARREKPELALMDIKLIGEMDGIETGALLRKIGVPVLFLTAHADETFLELAKLAEPLGYLLKPFDRKGLRAGVEMAHYKARMDRLVKESESRYRSMFENLPVAYLALDESGCFLDLNDELCDLLGYAQEELIGKNFIECCPPEMRNQYAEEFSKLKGTGRLKTELELVRKDNSQLTVLFKSRLQCNAQGKFLQMHGILHNITERKRAEEERLQLTRWLQQVQKAESLGRMAGAIAHHFNNHLQVVIGNLEMAMDTLPWNVDTVEILTETMKAVRKAAEVSGLMLIYQGQTPGRRAPMDLSETCRQILVLLQAAAPKGMKLKADFPSTNSPVILANANQIQQVLTHLITNAWEVAGENQGTVRLAVKTVSWTKIPVSKRFPLDWEPRKIDHACLKVADTGRGIAEKDIDKIFDPFFTTNFFGRGMGLPVILGIARAHGGGVTVESEPGRGSVFRVFFPMSAKAVSRPPDKPSQAPERQGSGTVLLIDDDEQVRIMSRFMLTRLGHSVLEANDGVEAVEMFRRHPDEINWVLTDLTMPRMNGWETMTALRNLSPNLPLILSSGYDEASIMADGHLERPNAFLRKPYRLKDLVYAIQIALRNA